MSQEITIILTKAIWCSHCQNFEPIYEKSKTLYKLNDYLKDLNIKFEDYDMADNDVNNTFNLNHIDIKDKIQGYPTVYIKNIINKKNNYIQLDHTVIDNKINIKEQINEASKRFLDNIINCLKTINSDNKSLFIKRGGNNTLKNDFYKNKYLKYKSKYIKISKK
jgi:thiol-disulfide isomerase/thioredoxin